MKNSQMRNHNKRMHKGITAANSLPIALLALLFAVTACTSIDCPMNNRVYTVYQITKANGTADTLHDSISIISRRLIEQQDPVLLNRDINISKIEVPISYDSPHDELFFLFWNKIVTSDTTYNSDETYVVTHDTIQYYAIDTVVVEKTDHKHFESIDCTPSFFHTIVGIQHTRNRIDSIVINNPEVNYDSSKEHFHLYLKPRP